MVKIEKYRGATKKDLENMSNDDALPMLTSRSRRALKRAMEGKNIDMKKLMKKVTAFKTKMAGIPQKEGAMPKAIKTRVRAAVVLPNWVGLTFGIYNGKEYKNILMTPDKIGYRLGDFLHTTTRVLHSGPGIGATRGSKFIPLK